MDLLDQIKSCVIGIVFPGLLIFRAVFYLAGEKTTTTRGGSILTGQQAFGLGLFLVGFAICIHAWGFRFYQNHPVTRYTLTTLIVILTVLGFWLKYQR